MQDSGIDCYGPAPRVAGWILPLRSLWDLCLPSLCLLLPGSLRGSLCRQKGGEMKAFRKENVNRKMVLSWWWNEDSEEPSGCRPLTAQLQLIIWVEFVSICRTWSDIHSWKDSGGLTGVAATDAGCNFTVSCIAWILNWVFHSQTLIPHKSGKHTNVINSLKVN